MAKDPGAHPIQFKWILGAKQVDDSGKDALYKACSVLGGDLRKPFEDFNPENICASIAAHENFCIILTIVAAKDLILE